MRTIEIWWSWRSEIHVKDNLLHLSSTRACVRTVQKLADLSIQEHLVLEILSRNDQVASKILALLYCWSICCFADVSNVYNLLSNQASRLYPQFHGLARSISTLSRTRKIFSSFCCHLCCCLQYFEVCKAWFQSGVTWVMSCDFYSYTKTVAKRREKIRNLNFNLCNMTIYTAIIYTAHLLWEAIQKIKNHIMHEV
jgi:hypothetical protein